MIYVARYLVGANVTNTEKKSIVGFESLISARHTGTVPLSFMVPLCTRVHFLHYMYFYHECSFDLCTATTQIVLG
jgi:hypothetical protein